MGKQGPQPGARRFKRELGRHRIGGALLRFQIWSITLHEFDWVTWGMHDNADLHFHITLAT